MPESDELLSPTDLHRKVNKFGLAFQRNHREAGDFPIQHVVVGKRTLYRKSGVESIPGRSKGPDCWRSAGGLTLGDDSLAQTLDQIIKTTPMGDETRKRITELLGADEFGERLRNAGGADDAA